VASVALLLRALREEPCFAAPYNGRGQFTRLPWPVCINPLTSHFVPTGDYSMVGKYVDMQSYIMGLARPPRLALPQDMGDRAKPDHDTLAGSVV
jgi:hypothetical protein